jgi:hypothetical protein
MRHPTARSRALLALPAAALLAVATAILPAAVPLGSLSAFAIPVARAATGLVVTSDTRYVVDPAGGVVGATVNLVAHNNTPDGVGAGGGTIQYFFSTMQVGVQPEATNLVARQDGVRVTLQVAARDGYRLVTIPLRNDIFLGQTAAVRLTFDLPAGAPRSRSDVRVGPAFASFLAWSFGDTGMVRIDVPSTFATDVSGADMTRASADGTDTFTASTTDALNWYAWVDARNDAGLTQERLAIPGGEQIDVRGWPEDTTWRKTVSSLLTRGVPGLVELIGLPWPVTGPLNVLEIHTPLLEGYAGFYNSARSEITVSEDLDPLTIVHEASHAWFNSNLFDERWINEGLADEYGTQVLRSLGDQSPGPDPVSRADPSAFPLEAWPPPAAIRDDVSEAKERYGYTAAWTVMHQIVTSAGTDGMRKVFEAAHAGTTAYVGAGSPEHAALPNDWRRLLDLTEELAGATGVSDVLATWALTPADAAGLGARASARAAYGALLTESGGRAAPWAVREPLDGWTFDVAATRIATAGRLVARLNAIAALASSAGLAEPPGIEGGYRDATDQAALDADEPMLATAEASLDGLVAATRAAAAPRDWLVTVGLLGSDPEADVASARSAWSGGDWNGADTAAAAAAATLGGADGAGRQRVAMGGGAAAGLVLLLLVVRLRRRRRRGPEWPDRYATLPASVPPEWAAGLPDEPPTSVSDAEQGADRS